MPHDPSNEETLSKKAGNECDIPGGIELTYLCVFSRDLS
jgi:hypothetical protein